MRYFITISTALTIALLAIGCQCRPAAVIPHADEFPTYAELAGPHNDRVDMLRTLYSRGVIEVEWVHVDGRRRRETQVDLDLYLMPERYTAYRASKLGVMYLWLGSDESQFWIFDHTGEENTLFVAPHDHAAFENPDVLVLHPLLLLDLMGLARLPEPDPERDQTVRYSQEHDAWVVETAARMQPWRVRLHFDRRAMLPKAAEMLGPSEEPLMTSTITLGRYRRATQQGMAAVNFPQMPTLVDVVALRPTEEIERIEVKIALDSPTGRVADQPMDRVFDLERLIRQFRPAKVLTP
jgi:hypothetical protein